MAKFVADLDVNQNQIKNGKFESLASDPSTGNFEGRLFYNSTEKVIKWRTDAGVRKALHTVQSSGSQATALTVSESNGTVSITANLASGSDAGLLSTTFYNLLNGATSSNTASTLVKRDVSGNFTAGTITATTVTGLNDPTNPLDAANKQYVDAARSGLDVKQSVHAASTANVTVTYSATGGTSGRGQITGVTNVIDGVTLEAGDRVLLKDQTTGAQNGIWVVTTVGTGSNGTWDRATDFDTDAEVTAGAFTFVEEGTVNGDSGFVLTTNNPITIGGSSGTALVWAQFSGSGTITAGTGMTKTGSTLDVIGTTDRIVANADSIDIAATYAGQTSIVTLGTVTTGTWSATTIAVNKGGTGLTSYTVGDILYADGAASLAKLTSIATGNVLISGGVATAPSWGKVGLTTHVSGTLAVGNGGTGATTFTANGILYGNTTSAVQVTSAGTQYQVLQAGASGVPTFGALNLSQAAAITGTLPIASGGTGATSAADARTNLAVPVRYTAAVAAGSTSATVTHNLNTTDVIVEVYEVSTGTTVVCDVSRASANAVTLGFSTAPTTNQYRVVINGVG